MATNAAQRQQMAEKLMSLGLGIVAIANPRGPDVDAILVKEPDYVTPVNTAEINPWKEMTGNQANTAYSLGI